MIINLKTELSGNLTQRKATMASSLVKMLRFLFIEKPLYGLHFHESRKAGILLKHMTEYGFFSHFHLSVDQLIPKSSQYVYVAGLLEIQ